MRLARSLLAVLSLALAGSALAQQYPAKPVRIIVPFPPGQATDILARLLADQLSKSLGQQFIADNRPGAGGGVGTEAAAKAAPDGYTLVMATISTFGINPSLYPKLGYSPLRDFAPISNLGLTPQTLVASPKSGFGSLKDFVAKAKTTELSYASSGNGSASHLSMELFRTASGAKLSHVPFKGNAEALTQVFGGEIPVMFDAIPGVLAPIKSGKVKALGIASSKRSPFLPDLPTIAEQGYPGIRGGRLDRYRGAGAHARADPEDAAIRDREGPRAAGDAEAHERARLHPGRRYARAVHRVHQGREREVGEGGEGVGREGGLAAADRSSRLGLVG